MLCVSLLQYFTAPKQEDLDRQARMEEQMQAIENREAELKARLTEIAETQEAFPVSFSHIGLFRLPQNDVLFAAPSVTREMLALKDRFMDSSDPFSWSPHTTLLIDKPDVIQRAIPVVLDGFSAMDGKVTALHLFEFWPTRHILSVELQ